MCDGRSKIWRTEIEFLDSYVVSRAYYIFLCGRFDSPCLITKFIGEDSNMHSQHGCQDANFWVGVSRDG